MSNLREEFEKLPEINAVLVGSDFKFSDVLNQYWHPNHTEHRLSYAFVMGAWYAFQEQQKKIYKVMEAIKMQEKYHDRQIDCLCDEIKDVLK